jgi:hypothetical protein
VAVDLTIDDDETRRPKRVVKGKSTASATAFEDDLTVDATSSVTDTTTNKFRVSVTLGGQAFKPRTLVVRNMEELEECAKKANSSYNLPSGSYICGAFSSIDDDPSGKAIGHFLLFAVTPPFSGCDGGGSTPSDQTEHAPPTTSQDGGGSMPSDQTEHAPTTTSQEYALHDHSGVVHPVSVTPISRAPCRLPPLNMNKKADQGWSKVLQKMTTDAQTRLKLGEGHCQPHEGHHQPPTPLMVLDVASAGLCGWGVLAAHGMCHTQPVFAPAHTLSL